MTEHAFWITSRAAGIPALLAASAGGRARPADEPAAGRRGSPTCGHPRGALAGEMLALAVHGLSLIGDSYLSPSLADVTIPFAQGYKTLWMGAGLIGGWGFIILGLSYYVRTGSASPLAHAAPLHRAGLDVRTRATR